MRDAHRYLASACVLLGACTNAVAPEGSAAGASHCAPSTSRTCPCFGGGSGRQICDDSGERYGACIGCADGSAGAPSTTGASDRLGAVPGIACGVAFPVLCAPQVETCCVRSLSVDSCIAAESGCACGQLSCVATAVRCDGPEDCANGQACCGTPAINRDGASGYTSFACADHCAADQDQACHVGQSTKACPNGRLCTNSPFLTNMQVCVDPASLAQ